MRIAEISRRAVGFLRFARDQKFGHLLLVLHAEDRQRTGARAHGDLSFGFRVAERGGVQEFDGGGEGIGFPGVEFAKHGILAIVGKDVVLGRFFIGGDVFWTEIAAFIPEFAREKIVGNGDGPVPAGGVGAIFSPEAFDDGGLVFLRADEGDQSRGAGLGVFKGFEGFLIVGAVFKDMAKEVAGWPVEGGEVDRSGVVDRCGETSGSHCGEHPDIAGKADAVKVPGGGVDHVENDRVFPEAGKRPIKSAQVNHALPFNPDRAGCACETEIFHDGFEHAKIALDMTRHA